MRGLKYAKQPEQKIRMIANAAGPAIKRYKKEMELIQTCLRATHKTYAIAGDYDG